MFALRCAVFSLRYFLIELPFNDSFNFFFAHRIFSHRYRQPNTLLKSQLSISVTEAEDNKINGEDTTKGKKSDENKSVFNKTDFCVSFQKITVHDR